MKQSNIEFTIDVKHTTVIKIQAVKLEMFNYKLFCLLNSEFYTEQINLCQVCCSIQ